MTSSIWSASEEAAKYQASRPDHPKEIADKIVAFLREGYSEPLLQAVDVGCGSGISTQNLLPHFSKVLGLDLSEAMVEQARSSTSSPGLQFEVGGAEVLPLPDSSVHLVMAGRAIHYFRQETFFQEVDRVLCPGGVLAYYSVHFPTVLHQGVNKLWWDILDSEELLPFWPVNPGDGHLIGARNRRDYYVDTIKPPYEVRRVDETISYDRPLPLATLAAELDTYSAVVQRRAKLGDEEGDKLVSSFLTQAMVVLGSSDPQIGVVTRNSFYVVMVRKPVE